MPRASAIEQASGGHPAKNPCLRSGLAEAVGVDLGLPEVVRFVDSNPLGSQRWSD